MRIPGLVDNVISRAELRHQRHVIRSSRAGTAWIVLAVLMLAPGVLTSLGAVVLVLLPLDDPAGWALWTNPIVDAVVTLGVVSLYTMNFALYLVLTLITLGLSYSSISREKTNRTWEVLLLTDVNARQMVRGKWWASLASLWGDHMILVVLRVGLGALIILTARPDDPLLYLGLLTLGMVAFTLVDTAFTVALGIASALSGGAAPITGTVVMVVRLVGALAAASAYLLALLLAGFGTLPMMIFILTLMVAAFAVLTLLALTAGRILAVRGMVSPAGALI